MITFESKVAKISDNQEATVVLFIGRKKSKDKKESVLLSVSGVSKTLAADIQKYSTEDIFTAKSGEHLFLRDFKREGIQHLLVVGVGEGNRIPSETLRRASAHAFKALRANKVKQATVSVESLVPFSKDAREAAAAVTEGFGLAGYKFEELKSKKDEKKQFPKEIVFLCPNASVQKSFQKGIDEGRAICESVNFARRLGDLPGNLMTPAIMAEEAQKAAKGLNIKVTIWDGQKIQKENMGLFWSVAKGSAQDPKFIIMEYKGTAASKAPICFVGKGLTFDSGGTSLKPAAAMEEMKYDMCGGANVIATILAAAKLKLKVNILVYVASSENLPGPTANKPGDICTARNGKTVEINNTDAEGRLILADALVYACEQKPAWIVDAATLTGAMKMALGDIHTGFFTGDAKFTKKIWSAAETSGELVWHMPMTDDHKKDMKGNYADLSNISYVAGAGSAKGAVFLREFVNEEIPWAHFDIAGTAWHTGSRVPYNPDKGASGVMVRTFIELAKLSQ